uniref:Photosystem I reaction center subunit VIII n=1 Tax=Eustigmatophyceae sp. Chic 10/23 P-6w TaxID=1446905 RepID=A0A451FMG5_9STRA|nr:photosystem I reaction center subunit VIII [Eustigmatophyceae sp. Chic 10/23 P-6w]QAA11595.1 photosystem I reaction center subunit VIII [Eustigmatophyceae sp. Chic 10/23 P-6w]
MNIDSLPSVLVPLVGLVAPFLAVVFLFLYIERENREAFDPTAIK